MMKSSIRPAVSLFVALTLITGIAYPLAVSTVSQLAFSHAAHGSLVLRDGKPVGSALIGQSFTDPRYVWGRPSATSDKPYNALASGGSNLGPSNPALADAVKARIAALKAADPAQTGPVPMELVTASGSGLDPQVSPAAAIWQAPRIAKVRNVPLNTVRSLIDQHTEAPLFGLLGEPRVNVLALNLALDALPAR